MMTMIRQTFLKAKAVTIPPLLPIAHLVVVVVPIAVIVVALVALVVVVPGEVLVVAVDVALPQGLPAKTTIPL
jgi:hypothetical protein